MFLIKTNSAKLLLLVAMCGFVGAASAFTFIESGTKVTPPNFVTVNGIYVFALHKESDCSGSNVIYNKASAGYFSTRLFGNNFSIADVTSYNMVWNALAINEPGTMPSSIHGVDLSAILAADAFYPNSSLCTNCTVGFYSAFSNRTIPIGGLQGSSTPLLPIETSAKSWPADTCLSVTCNDSTSICTVTDPGQLYINMHQL